MARATKKRKWPLSGGPYDGQTIFLATPTTMVFTASGQTGRYRQGKSSYIASACHPDDVDRMELSMIYLDESSGGADAVLYWEKVA